MTLPTFSHPYSGEVTISGDLRADLREALMLEHGHADPSYGVPDGCGDNSCDIGAAMTQGFVLYAAHALMSATDAELTSAVIGWYCEHGTDADRVAIGTHAYDNADWDAWSAWHAEHSIECPECGGRVYFDEWDADGETCDNCRAFVGPDRRYLTAATDAYEEAADFTDTDRLSRDAAEHGIDVPGWHQSTLDTFAADVESFITASWPLVAGLDPRQVGHDFWLTRNRHGAGFWDGDYAEDLGRKLTDAAHAEGSCELYVGDDGFIYAA